MSQPTVPMDPAETPVRRVGRPPKFDAAALAVVERLAREHGGDSLRELGDRIEQATGVRVTDLTLSRRLHELGFRRVVPGREPSRPAANVLATTGGTGDPASSGEAAAAAVPARKRYGYGPQHRTKAPEALYQFGLSDAEWAVVADLFEDKVRGTPRQHSRRLMIDAMCYVVRSGASWRMLPREFPPWHQVFKTFQRWSRQGRFEKMYDRLRELWRQREGRAAEATVAVIDSQSVKTSPQGGPKGFDGAKKVKGRKRHLLTDTLGLLITVIVQVASIQDRAGADEVVAAGLAKMPGIRTVYTDEGYSGQCKLRIERAHPGVSVKVVRHPANRSVGVRVQAQQPLPLAVFAPKTFVPMPKRWVIERTNAWNDRPRRLAKDHDRTLQSSTAWIWFAEGRRLLHRIASPPDPA